MSKFEFTITIVSIVIAFGLSELMAGWGRVLRHDPPARQDWLFSGWSAGVVLLAILHWSGLWFYEDVAFLYLYQLFFLLLPPLVLVAVAFLLAPNPETGETLDLRAHFERVARPVFLLLAAFTVLGVIADLVVAASSPYDEFSVFAVVGALYTVLLLGAAFSTSVILRGIVLVLHWALWLPIAVGLLPGAGWDAT